MAKLTNKRTAKQSQLLSGFRIFTISLAIISASVFAQDNHHPHSNIKTIVKSFVSEQLSAQNIGQFDINVGELDKRLKLVLCNESLHPFFSPGSQLSGNTTVGIRCTGPKPWTVYIPTEITVYRNVLASRHPILKGQIVGQQDVNIVRKTMNARGSQYISEPSHIIGLIAKRSIPAGKTLSPHMFQAPRLVNRGQAVILLAKTQSLEVRMKGQALADGAKGDVIQVRNARSNRVIEGTVTKRGVVEVNM